MVEQVNNFDIVIIGASLSGTYLSSLILPKGFKIGIVEEHKEVGTPLQCAGIVSQKLKRLTNFPEKLILNRVKRAKLVSPTGRKIFLSGDENPYIIDRVEFDKYFYNKIKNDKHFQIFLEEKFKNYTPIKENNKKILIVKTNKRKLKTKLLIGCDGPLSAVGQLLNQENRIIYASQERVKGDFPENEASMYFHPKWKELFGWIVPEGNDVFRIGLASANNIASNFRKFKKHLRINDDQIIDHQGGLIPYGIMNKIAFNNILLLGDAAGQVKATTGGGIIMLLTAAKYAADCISKCLKCNNYSERFIKKYYEIPCKKTIGRELKIHWLIRLFLEHLTSKEFDRLLQILKISKLEEIISFYGDMDFPKNMLVKLLGNFYVLKFLFTHLLRNPLLILKIFNTIRR